MNLLIELSNTYPHAPTETIVRHVRREKALDLRMQRNYTLTANTDAYEHKTSRCDLCNDPESGNRYSLTARSPHSDDETMHVCTDCYYFVVHGSMPAELY